MQQKVGRMVRNYRVRGHIIAKLDPLKIPTAEEPAELDPAYYDLSEDDMNRTLAPRYDSGDGRTNGA